MNEIYQAPESQLSESIPQSDSGSIEKALAGDYSIQVGEVLGEAWGRVKGSKWKFQLAFGLYFLLYIFLFVALAFVFQTLGMRSELPAELQDMPPYLQFLMGAGFIESTILMVLSIPAWIGVMMLGVRRAVDDPIRARDILKQYKKIVPLSITYILMYVLIVIGFILLVIPGIYLTVAYSMATYLVVEKNLSPWQALETSRKAVTKRWFSLFGLYVVIFLISMIAIIPLGIGLIWTIPLGLIAAGVAYRRMFGCESEAQIS